MLKFIHLRRFPYYEIGDDTRREMSPKGGVTIGYTETPSQGNVLVEFSIAKCCPKDHFCKSLGRTIASGRGNAGQTEQVIIPAGLPRGEIRKILVEKYYEQNQQLIPQIRELIK